MIIITEGGEIMKTVLNDMETGETATYGHQHYTRVPGGWVYALDHSTFMSAPVFIPEFLNVFMMAD